MGKDNNITVESKAVAPGILNSLAPGPDYEATATDSTGRTAHAYGDTLDEAEQNAINALD